MITECRLIQILNKPNIGFVMAPNGPFFYVFRKPTGRGRNKEQLVTVYPLNELAIKKCAEDIKNLISKK